MKKTGRPLMLMILDGWGENSHDDSNAIAKAQIPNYQRLKQEYPATTLEASGEVVGLPGGQMGNSEVGHLNIGAGRVVYQELTRIDRAIKTGEFFQNPVLIDVMDKVIANNTSLHLMGLLSDGGVHSHIEHLYALLEMAKERGVSRVWVHAFLDGRDVPPANAKEYIVALEERMRRLGVGAIATVMGRFYAMDRDKRWERVELAYNTMVLGQGLHQATFARGAVEQSYEMRVTDEFVEPNIIVDEQGRPRATVQDGDGIIFFNFRADRARELTRAFVDREFDGFTRQKWPQVNYVCLTQYDIHIQAPVAFPPQNLENTLGEVLAKNGLTQLRIAETEKYAHVTFFFNGGVEEPNPGEDRVLIPSPKVATYNLKPEMSALEVTDRVIQEIESDRYDVIIINYANPDMVGHTGIMEAAIKAITVVDQCLGRVVEAVLAAGGKVLITADHGNAEEMVDPKTGQPHTAHTLGRVPFILVDPDHRQSRLRSGSLEDIAPTMLQLLGLPKPAEMTGRSLIMEGASTQSAAAK